MRRIDQGLKRPAGGLLLTLAAMSASGPVAAAPWLPVGDSGLRSDVEILAAHGLVDALLTSWPLPAGQFKRLDDDERLAREPEYVQRAAARVRAALRRSGLEAGGDLRLASESAVVRGFDTLARDDVDARAVLAWNDAPVEGELHAGLISDRHGDSTHAALDGSFLSTLLGNVRAYGGWVEQWNGPGWSTSLILSNNARPFPKIGLMRDEPRPFESRWLSWLGPWQADFFVGLLDDEQRLDDNTVLGSLRLSINPVPGLELVAMRSVEFCGDGHECDPFDAAFHLNNDDKSTNSTNEEATLEFKYSRAFGALSVSPYFQMMNEDTGPFTHSYTSYLGGVSLAAPWGDTGAQWRLSAEYVDTVATKNAFGFGTRVHGIAYANGGYPDGFRYRGRTLGFSLDSDSRLASLDFMVVDGGGRRYSLTAYRAHISTPELAAIQASGDETAFHNVVSAVPLRFSELDAAVSIPLRGVALDFIVRGRDKSLPADLGDRVEVEAGLSFRF